MWSGTCPTSPNSRRARLILTAVCLGALGTVGLTVAARAADEVRITNQAQSSSTPAVAHGPEGRLSAVWSDTRDGNSEIYYCALDAWGNRLTGDVNVSGTAAASVAPRLGVDAEGNVYVVWRESNNAYVAKLDWQGNPLVAPKGINLGSYVVFQNPDISVPATGGCAVGVGARVSANYDLWVIRFDAGLNQGCRTSGLFINATASNGPRVSIETTSAFASSLTFWRESIDPFDFGNSLTTIGATSGCVRGSRTDLCSGNSFPTIDRHGHGVVFERSSKVWLSSGSGCGQQLSENPGPSVSPSAAALDATRSIAVWRDNRSGNSDLYFATYTSAFVKEGPDVAFVTGGSSSTVPAVASDGAGNAFVVWQDDRDGNAEIYFARTPEPAGYGTIVGTVYNGVTGQPMPFAFVDVLEPDHVTMKNRRIVAGADGRYRVAGLAPAGPWALTASSEGFTSPQTTGVEVRAGQTVTVDLRVTTGSVLGGTIRDAFNGLPIRGAHVRADSTGGLPTRSLETGPDGRYRFDVYPGVYDVLVEVPSVGEAGPFFSPEHDYYKGDSRIGVVVSATPRDEPIPLETNTVVLVHGIASHDWDWGSMLDPLGAPDTLRRVLEDAGWHTEALSYDWKRSIEEAGGELHRWLAPRAFQSSRVVAHSMGGLTARWCAERIAGPAGEQPFAQIITLGTLHHGTPLSSNLQALVKQLGFWPQALLGIPNLPTLTDFAVEAALQSWAPCFNDFEPGSDRLNLLNYGNGTPHGFDGPQFCNEGEPDPTHPPEDLMQGVGYVALAGDNPQNHAGLHEHFMNKCPSDGAVPVHSAKLYRSDPAVRSFVMSCFAGAECDVGHEPQRVRDARLKAAPAALELRHSSCVHDRVRDALEERPIACESGGALVTGVAAAESLLASLPPFEHLLAPGESALDTLTVQPGGTLAVFAQWRQDGVTLDLESPLGARIDSVACADSPGLFFESDPTAAWARMKIADPAGGDWIIRVISTSGSAQQVSVRPFITSDVVMMATASPRLATPGSPVRVTAHLQRAGSALLGAEVTGVVGRVVGTTTPIDLLDDGTGGDLLPDDGLYTATFVPDSAGSYAVRLVASGGAGGPYGSRAASTGFLAAPGLDVALPPSSIATPQLWAYPSDLLPVTFHVRNAGPLDADSVWVYVRDDSAGVAVMDTIVAIPAADSVPLVARFKATQTGLHMLRFQARVLDPVVDTDRTNSFALRGFEIVPFGAAPTIVSVAPRALEPPAPRGIPTRVVPNPSRGSAVIEFELPRATDNVTLTLVDVTGRRVVRSALGRLEPGLHRVPWRLPAREASWSSGVLFYRIQAGSMTGTGRIVTIR